MHRFTHFSSKGIGILVRNMRVVLIGKMNPIGLPMKLGRSMKYHIIDIIRNGELIDNLNHSGGWAMFGVSLAN